MEAAEEEDAAAAEEDAAAAAPGAAARIGLFPGLHGVIPSLANLSDSVAAATAGSSPPLHPPTAFTSPSMPATGTLSTKVAPTNAAVGGGCGCGCELELEAEAEEGAVAATAAAAAARIFALNRPAFMDATNSPWLDVAVSQLMVITLRVGVKTGVGGAAMVTEVVAAAAAAAAAGELSTVIVEAVSDAAAFSAEGSMMEAPAAAVAAAGSEVVSKHTGLV